MREKLIEFLDEAYFDYRHGNGDCDMIRNIADHLIANGVTLESYDCHWATEQAYKNGFKDGQRAAIMDSVPRFLVKAPSKSIGEMQKSLVDSPVIYSNGYEEIIPITPWRGIPVTERLPKEGEEVLVFGYWHEKFQPLICYLSPHRKGEWFTTVGGQQVYEVTHWMPLPEPPNEV